MFRPAFASSSVRAFVLRATCPWFAAWIAFCLPAASPSIASAAEAPDGHAPICTWSPPEWGDADEVSCPLPPKKAASKLRLTAIFLGSHDDTQLSMAATLAGQDVSCLPGDRQQSAGEFGDQGKIVLACRVEVPPAKGAEPAELRVRLQWHHAQPESFVVTEDP